MKRIHLLLTLIAISILLSCTSKVKDQYSKSSSEIKHVVLIGADGFAASVLRENPNLCPNIEKMMKEGSYSLEARSVLPSSSAVNWAGILMGAGPEVHGYTQWNSQIPELESRQVNQYGRFPGIYGLIRDNYPNATLAYGFSWSGMKYLYDKEVVDFNYDSKDNDDSLEVHMIDLIKNHKPTFSFMAFHGTDSEGHKLGWGTEEYKIAAKKIDTRVGHILQAIKKAGIEKETVVMFIADHGGKDKGHGGKTMQEMQVPFIIYGHNVHKGLNLKGSYQNYDMAGNIAYLLGIPIPEVWRAHPAKEAFMF